MHKKIALVSLVIILCIVNWSIAGKEKHLAEGRIIFLDLAPVDPRSLMQGDYMALNFRLANKVSAALRQTKNYNHAVSDGFVVVRLDERNIATYRRLYKDQALSQDEIIIRYRVRNGDVSLGTNAYFFQEGHGQYYESASYGQFRVDEKGELLLVAMYDDDLNKLEPKVSDSAQ